MFYSLLSFKYVSGLYSHSFLNSFFPLWSGTGKTIFLQVINLKYIIERCLYVCPSVYLKLEISLAPPSQEKSPLETLQPTKLIFLLFYFSVYISLSHSFYYSLRIIEVHKKILYNLKDFWDKKVFMGKLFFQWMKNLEKAILQSIIQSSLMYVRLSVP